MKGIQMFKLPVLAILLSISFYSHSSIEEYTREYTYNASENDSKVTARKSAMQQLQSLLIQEVGVQVQSSFSNKEVLKGDDFNKEMAIHYETFAQALTKTKVLDEQWDGEEFYLKALISIDTESFGKTLKSLYENRQTVRSTDSCEDKSEKALRLLSKKRTDKVIEEIVTLSIGNSFDLDCDYWQYQIMKSFSKSYTHHPEYRRNLFNAIMKEESNNIYSELVISALQYALKIQPLSEEEWNIIIGGIERGTDQDAKSIASFLIVNTKSPYKIETKLEEYQQARKQKYSDLEQKIADLIIEFNKLEKQSFAEIQESELVASIIRDSMDLQPNLSHKYFMDYFDTFDDNHKNKLVSSTVKRYIKYKDKLSYQMVNTLFENLKINYQSSKILYSLFVKMEDTYLKKEQTEFYDFSALVKKHEGVIKKVLNTVKVKDKSNIKMAAKYNISL